MEILPNTAFRYFQQWKKLPKDLEATYSILKAADEATPELREKIVEEFVPLLRLKKNELRAHLEKPWGLKRMLMGSLSPSKVGDPRQEFLESLEQLAKAKEEKNEEEIDYQRRLMAHLLGKVGKQRKQRNAKLADTKRVSMLRGHAEGAGPIESEKYTALAEYIMARGYARTLVAEVIALALIVALLHARQERQGQGGYS